MLETRELAQLTPLVEMHSPPSPPHLSVRSEPNTPALLWESTPALDGVKGEGKGWGSQLHLDVSLPPPALRPPHPGCGSPASVAAGLLRPTLLGPTPRRAHSPPLGQAGEIALLRSSQVVLSVLAPLWRIWP